MAMQYMIENNPTAKPLKNILPFLVDAPTNRFNTENIMSIQATSSYRKGTSFIFLILYN